MFHNDLLEKLDKKPYGYGNNLLQIAFFDMCYMLIGNSEFIDELKNVIDVDLSNLITNNPKESAENVFNEEETIIKMLNYVIETRWGTLDE